MRVALVAGDPIRHQDLMAIIRDGGHAVVEHHGEADVVLVDGESVDLHGPPAVTLGGADSGQAGYYPPTPRRFRLMPHCLPPRRG